MSFQLFGSVIRKESWTGFSQGPITDPTVSVCFCLELFPLLISSEGEVAEECERGSGKRRGTVAVHHARARGPRALRCAAGVRINAAIFPSHHYGLKREQFHQEFIWGRVKLQQQHASDDGRLSQPGGWGGTGGGGGGGSDLPGAITGNLSHFRKIWRL